MPQKSHAKPAWEDVDITHHQPLPPQLNKNRQQQQWHHNHYRQQQEWQQQQGLEMQMRLKPQVCFFSFLFSCSTNHYSLDYATYYAYRTMTTPHLLPGLCSYSSYQGHQTSKGGNSMEVLHGSTPCTRQFNGLIDVYKSHLASDGIVSLSCSSSYRLQYGLFYSCSTVWVHMVGLFFCYRQPEIDLERYGTAVLSSTSYS